MTVLKQKKQNIGFPAERYRKDFPILRSKVYGKSLVYLDNAATTQKPQAVIDALSRYYREENANIHRGVYYLSEKATDAYESVRALAQRFIHASSPREIVFVRGATEGLNLIAQSFGRMVVGKGDEIIISEMEHHSNIVPWQILCEQIGAVLRVIPINDEGELKLNEFEKLLNSKTKLVSIVHISNSLGTINPIREIIKMAHAKKVPVVVDGAQSVPHRKVDVQELDCDFFVFSGHKMYGPTGIGAVYGKLDWLQKMPPYQGGGDMISSVTFKKTQYNKVPYKFEAGTPHIAGVIGLGAAMNYLNEIGLDKIAAYETDLLEYATEKLESFKGLRLVGTAKEKAGILSFVLSDVHAHDVGTILDRQGIAIRAGHHCTMPVMDRFGLAATARASLSFYNTREDVDRFIEAVRKVYEVFK